MRINCPNLCLAKSYLKYSETEYVEGLLEGFGTGEGCEIIALKTRVSLAHGQSMLGSQGAPFSWHFSAHAKLLFPEPWELGRGNMK